MSRIAYFWIVLLFVALIILVFALVCYILFLKKQIGKLRENLRLTRQMDNNQQLTISLFDKDLSELATEINKNLDFQKGLKLESERKEQQMRQSVSDIAHDLRTPLTVVKGNLQLMNQETLSKRFRSCLEICLDKTDVLKNMVDDFFELSVLESESIVPELKRLDVTNYLMQFLIDHEAIIVKEGLTPNLWFPEKSVFVMADESMLGRIFSNLLNNIVKYAKESFDIRLVEEADRVVLTFSNEIQQDADMDVKHLFDRTYRADKARQEKGAGLGLYIVKLLSEKQRIDVWAQREGRVLCFHLIFPK